MSRQIEQALLSLMPAQGDDLPPQLVGLAESLLAQSRHKASTLKAEEDIARLYACAHIACDRLKISLDLPPIAPRPPIPPRNYKRLYEYLDRVLQGASSTPKRGTPGSRRNQDHGVVGDPTSERPLPSRGTPTKESSLAGFRTPSKATPTKSTARRSSRNVMPQLPDWIRPVTRFICSGPDDTMLASTVIAGMESIMLPAGRRSNDDWVNENPTALLAVIHFYTRLRVKAILTGAEVDRDTYMATRGEILALLGRARSEVTLKDEQDENGWSDWSEPNATEFDVAIRKLISERWLEHDWYRGIADVLQANGLVETEANPIGDDAEYSQSDQVRRIDTMFQDRFDYLSDTRRADYKVWKERMLKRIAQASTASGAMEIDPA